MPNNDLPTTSDINEIIAVEFIKPVELANLSRSNAGSIRQKTQGMPTMTAATRKLQAVLAEKPLKDAQTPAIASDNANHEIKESSAMTTGESALTGELAADSGIGGGGGSGDGSGTDADGNGSIGIYKLRPKYSPSPNYPKLSREKAEQGTIILLVKVDAHGIPIEAKILKSSGFPLLDENTRRNILARWQFYPALRKGVPIPAYVLAEQIYVMNGQAK